MKNIFLKIKQTFPKRRKSAANVGRTGLEPVNDLQSNA